jgi:GMP synthase (glutamine-hydrolysing)
VDEPRRQGDASRPASASSHLDGAPFAIIADDERALYGTQFHPEVVHTPDGAQADRQFRAHMGLRLRGRLDDGGLPRPRSPKIREQVGRAR